MTCRRVSGGGRGISCVGAGREAVCECALGRCRESSGRDLCASERVGRGLDSFAGSSEGVLPVVKGQDVPVLIGQLDEADVMRAYNRALEQLRDEEHGDQGRGSGYLG